MDRYDVLLIGFGPISYRMLKEFLGRGLRVAVISDSQTNFHDSCSYDAFSWCQMIDRQIVSEVSYLNWRHMPKEHQFGPSKISWMKSSKLATDKIIHLSSASVYPNSDQAHSESEFSHDADLDSGNHKQTLERFVFEIAKSKCMSFTQLRLSNVYGYPLKTGFISESVENIILSKPLRVYSGQGLIRDYVHIEDAVSAIISLHELGHVSEAINISTSIGVSSIEVVALFQELLKTSLEIQSVDWRSGDPLTSILDCSLLADLITWAPRSIEVGVSQTLEIGMNRREES
jgi:nucleoside-diphosphate-sugar epimerase